MVAIIIIREHFSSNAFKMGKSGEKKRREGQIAHPLWTDVEDT